MPPKSSFTSPGRCTGWSGSRSHNSRTIRSSWIPGPALTRTCDARSISEQSRLRPLYWSTSGPRYLRGVWCMRYSSRHSVPRKARKGMRWKRSSSSRFVVSDHLFLPEGSRLKGSVLQVRPARRFSRNGQLRIVFHQVVPPTGIQQTVEASLEGVAVEKGEHLRLDSEGGAQVTTLKTRYLTTAISVLLASSSMADHDRDAGMHGADGGDLGKGAANGASGFHFLGTIV